MLNKTKFIVTMLTAISVSGILYTQSKEGTVLVPYKDSVGVATIGTGTTVYPNGQKVKMTDPKITEKQATEYLKFHIDKDAKIFNKSLLGIPLSQTEYDLYMDFTYQFGTGAWSQSSMLRNLKSRNYVQACKSLLKWKYAAKRDCSIRSNNCYGVWTRQQARYDKCMGEN
ncbi:lysozyme [Acinetobacter terrestris]|uniref:Lysozyme n=2 Tax=Acinetobacter terrestris TaxID=2529843 RepID=A0AAW6UW01_9GAMM|nr:lysozyme [Acinetobacter terrestris]MDK1683462.1 lysozyme [Acinetobacter terrestris]